MSRAILAKDIGLKFPRTTRKKAAARKAKVDEKTIQAQAEAYLDNLALEYLHIPAYILNAAFGFHGKAPTGPQLYAMSLAKQYVTGFPDLCVFHPNRKNYIAVELKTEIGKLSPLQVKWQQSLGTFVCRSIEEFKETVQAWLKETT